MGTKVNIMDMQVDLLTKETLKQEMQNFLENETVNVAHVISLDYMDAYDKNELVRESLAHADLVLPGEKAILTRHHVDVLETGGMDLLSTLLHPLFPMMRLANIIGIVDGIIVVAGMLVFGVRTALYSIVAVFVTSKVMDGVTSGMRYAKIMYIISDQSAEIAEIILHQFERGVTALRGNGMYSGKEKQILMCVVSRREAVSMVKYVKEADERAFVIVADAREVLGEGFSIGN